MKIEITNSNATGLIDLINKFPNGNVTAEDNKAYWVWEISATQPIIKNPQNPQLNEQKKGNTFLNMFDSLASRI